MLTESHLYREIFQQPEILDRLLAEETDSVTSLAEAMQRRDIDNVIIAARGSSDNAARYAQYLLGSVNDLPVGLTTPSLFTIYKQPPRFSRNSLVFGISQSGQSPDIVSVLAEAKRQNVLTATLTNDPDSPLARNADHIIRLHAGDERSIAATKTYTGQLAAIALLSAHLSGDPDRLDSLHAIPQKVERTLDLNQEIAARVERYRYANHCVVIGRGYNYATAFEIALKLKELTYTIAEPYSSADFLHGPLAVIEHGFPVLVVAPSGLMLGEMETFVAKLHDREAEIISISDDAALSSLAHCALPLPEGTPEWLSPLVTVIPGQVFSMNLAYERHYDPDHPRGLHKVTETL